MSPQSHGRRPKKTNKPSQRRRVSRDHSRTDLPAESARYTPPGVVIRIRPTSHKVTGWVLVALGVALALINDAAWLGVNLMPGGHNELYLFLALGIAAFGGWWLGVFDAPG